MTNAEETVLMTNAGFTWDPARNGMRRWTHFKSGVTALCQPYMSHQQWEECMRKAIAESVTNRGEQS